MYNEDSIEVLSLREAIQRRPRMYLGREKFDIDALYTLISWLVEGAVSKKGVNLADHVDIVLERDNWVTISDNGVGLPIDTCFDWIFSAYGGALSNEDRERIERETDNYKNIPPEFQSNPKVKVQPIIKVTFTRIFTGDITDREAYYGFPINDGAMLNALSAHMIVQTHRDGALYEIAFKDGVLNKPLTLIAPSTDRGTRIRFQPEMSLFKRKHLRIDRLAQILEATPINKDAVVSVSRK